MQRAAHRRLRRLQGRARSDLRAVRAGALRRVHHRGDLRPAGVPPRRSGRRDRQAAAFGRSVSRARAPGRRLFARQGAAGHRADPRRPDTTGRSICTARWRASPAITSSTASTLGELRPVRGVDKAELAGAIALCPPSSLQDLWTRRFPDPVPCFASGWMRVRARARQRGVELPLVISDHADWDGLTATIAATGASEIWVTHGQEDALVHWCRNARTEGAAARHRRLRRRGRERQRDRSRRRGPARAP